MSNQNPYPSPYDPSSDGSQPANQPQVPQPQAGDAQPSLPPLSYQGWEYQGTPYGEAHAASSDADAASQSVPSPTDPSGEDTAPKKHTGWWILLTLVGILLGTVLYFFGEMFDFGTERIVWTLIKCAVALVFALAMIPLYAATRRNYLMRAHGAMRKWHNNASAAWAWSVSLASDSPFTRCRTAFPRCLTSPTDHTLSRSRHAASTSTRRVGRATAAAPRPCIRTSSS